ncbi:MAG: hypothetical protein Q4E62_05515 [Sutterellaceae bacterium]|nr:hypothetical protein [Sutterellaceae bacterium]
MKYLSQALKDVFAHNREFTKLLLETNIKLATKQVDCQDQTFECLAWISHIDKVTGACKISLDKVAVDNRLSAVIIDPALSVPGNAYLNAFVSGELVRLRCKLNTESQGEGVRLEIVGTF